MAAPLVGGALTCTNIAKAAASSFSITKPVAGALTAESGDVGDTDTFTFNNVDIGTAGASRVVHVSVYLDPESAGTTITGVTIGGSPATEIQNAGNDASAHGMWYLLVTTGTTATIVVTCSVVEQNQCAIDVWRIEAATGNAPTDSGIDSATAYSIAATVPASGSAIAGFVNKGTGNITWTGATEIHDTLINVAQCSAASFTSSVTIQASGVDTAGVMSYASYGP